MLVTSMQIPAWPISTQRELQLLQEVLESPQWGGFHPMVGRFEVAFAAAHHAAHGVSAMNGTVTLEMMLTALGIGPGHEVIVPAISFISTATSVSRVGATPVFVDIEPHSYNIDPIRAALAITIKTKAIIAVHFGGPMAQMDRLRELSSHYSIPILEDAAHAHATEWNGQRAGSLGLAGSFSFQNGKVMTSGEGGIVLTNDADLAERIRSIANQGRRRTGPSYFHHFDLGSNFRMTAFQAAVLIAQLERLEAQTELRRRNAAILMEELAGVSSLEWQRGPAESNRHSWYLLVGRTAGRDEFCRRVQAAGVPVTPFYPHPLYQNPLYSAWDSCVVTGCPVAEESIKDSFWFPHRVLMGDEAFTRELADVIRRAAQG
jgi:dTDP-4-amino-4,6-dideoxygalactose transaminase